MSKTGQRPEGGGATTNPALGNSITGFRRRRPMTTAPYKPKFAQLVNKLMKRTTFEFTKLVEQLKVIEEMVRVDTFIYNNKKEELEGKLALLALWKQLMELADIVPAYRQNLFYTLIFFIVTRYEFDLIHITVPKTDSSTEKKKVKKKPFKGLTTAEPATISMTDEVTLKPDADDLEVFRQYKLLLTLQTQKVLEQFEQKNLSKVMKKFCSQMLSVSYFRLPILSGPIINACSIDTSPVQTSSEPADPDDAIDGDEAKTSAEACDSIQTVSKDPIRAAWAARNRSDDWVNSMRERVLNSLEKVIEDSTIIEIEDRDGTSDFFRANPTLFQWTLLMENDDRKLLTKSRCLSKLSNERHFFKFVSRLVAHVNDVLHVSSSSSLDFELIISASSRQQEDGDGDDEQVYQFDIDRSIRWGLIPGYWSLVRAVLKRSLVRNNVSFMLNYLGSLGIAKVRS
jgi:hypothetical protein